MTPEGTKLIELSDKYMLDRGRVLMSGRQALVRLPLVQRRLDRARALNTAGFITGYRGSPLGTYDLELQRAQELLALHQVVFQPGVNEDLAATAAWGTQQIGFLPGRKVQGVFSIWYGKGPGVDRSGDVFKHANLAGTEPHGGVLLVFGDDHAGKSSSTAHQSDLSLAALDIPVLYPASVAEILEYGLAGIELSRYSGLLVGLKIVNETADTTSTVTVDTADTRFVRPDPPSAADDVHIRKEFLALQAQDARLVRQKLPRALAFARANGLNRIAFGASRPRFLIVTAGKAYADVRSALDLLEIGEADAVRIGLGVYKVGLIYPLDSQGLQTAAQLALEVFCVEEKRAHLEPQAASALYSLESRPRLYGKFDPQGVPLLPADVPLDSLTVAHAIARRLAAGIVDIDAQLARFAERARAIRERLDRSLRVETGLLARPPAFCPGCPHNTSTAVPAGSHGMTGIGCHAIAMLLPSRNPLPVTHMGGEGATWLGMQPFSDTAHVFQNLGDGTYNHSGSMAIRAAVQARANITYKILYNDAIAMTGGQPVEGEQSVRKIAMQVLAEGVARVAVVADDPDRHRRPGALPDQVSAYSRDDLDAVQRSLRDTPGVTVLIYDQTCATEQRRRRKRGLAPDPDRRVFINEAVCEGCGDCSVQSNCLAIQPLETDLGRKRSIDQSACNKDEACTRGFCPSFVTVEGARLRGTQERFPEHLLQSLPEIAPPPLLRGCDILLAGIGGTGVVTISAVIGMAAHLEGFGASTYDMTGLSQKGGAVFSHVRLGARAEHGAAATIPAGGADLLLACDVVSATQKEALAAIDPAGTVVIANCDVTATARFQLDPDLNLEEQPLLDGLARACAGRMPSTLRALTLAREVLGDAITANMIMLGFAWQRGCVPLARGSIERAIEMNGVAVPLNLRSFALGRAAAIHTGEKILAAARLPAAVPAAELSPDLDTFLQRRADDLTQYWNADYAQVYRELVQEARSREAALGVTSEDFAWAVARAAFKVMAYKDEYEVARLYSDGRFRAALDAQLEPGYRLKYRFAPPGLTRADPNTARPRKIVLGGWMTPLLHVLARLKRLRETPLDVFGYTAERRMERRLRDQYLRFVRTASSRLDHGNHAQLVSVARLPLSVRGFGLVKAPAAAAVLRQL